jgi:Bacteriophage tail sheath protein
MPEYLSPGVYVEEVAAAVQAIVGVGTSTAGFIGTFAGDTVTVLSQNPDYDPTAKALEAPAARDERPAGARAGRGAAARVDDTATPPAADAATSARALPYRSASVTVAPAGEVRLCTNFSEFKREFGDFSTDAGQSGLAHAVFGFFNNGGRRCYVTRVADAGAIGTALEKFEAIDEIAIVAAPGVTDASARDAILSHCERTGDRFAILDSAADAPPTDAMLPPTSKNAAFYYPWIAVFDPVEKLQRPAGNGLRLVPPSGHLAGIYARVDSERGVHKAPANEVVRGATGLAFAVSKAQQAGLNPRGINCIRDMNGSIRVWGARTIGGDANGEWKYVNVRRLFLFLRESIDEGTQWTVFEPNDRALWAKITLNVTAFLTGVWRAGALFGATPEEAFYVKCDAETNPPAERELGRVITEVGVAIVRPAEFVIFRVSQWAGPERR